ncbi:MAG TPA: helical backbone metal receptor [Labilithrix sp.]
MNRRAFLAALALAACRRSPIAKKDGPATRIVSLSPSTTETVFAIGAGASLVGRSRYCDYPPEVLKLPQVGGYVDPSFEAILALSPDLVTGARGPSGDALTKRLEERGIATYFPPTESIAAIAEMIRGLGARTARGADAERVIDTMNARLAKVKEEASSAPPRRVLLVFGLEPLAVAGPASFPDEMLRLAGANNVITEGGAYPTIGVEHALRLDPDVILDAAMAEGRAKERLAKDAPGWSSVRAVKEGRVRRLDDEAVLRPGPRVGDGVAAIAAAIRSAMEPSR